MNMSGSRQLLVILALGGETADGSVALIIILDQFPLNMFRSEAKGFQN